MLSPAIRWKGRTTVFTFLRLMMKQRHTSPAVEGFRTMALSDSGVVYQYSVRRAKFARRKRLEVRRLKCSSLTKPCFPGDNECFKKTKFENGDLDSDVSKSEDYSEKRAYELSLSYSSSSDCFSENDVFSSRISSFKGEALERGGKLRSVPRSSHGSISVIGRRREMEDAVTVELGFLNRDSTEYDFFGVYDGHGGSSVAHACRDRLHCLLAKEIEEGGAAAATTSVDWEKVMVACFGKMDEEVYDTAMKKTESTALSETIGSTAVVAVVGEEVVVVANCGDSRAVLSRGGVAVSMSNDHKPDRPDELERIEGAGGKVINWEGHRVLGVLSTSRSIGDHYLKPYVIPKPEVIVSKRTEEDEFLILATDGLWDVVSNEVACQVVRRCLGGRMKRRFQLTVNQSRSSEVVYESRAAEAAAVLAELAMARGSKDNVSVVVVDLNKIGECRG